MCGGFLRRHSRSRLRPGPVVLTAVLWWTGCKSADGLATDASVLDSAAGQSDLAQADLAAAPDRGYVAILGGGSEDAMGTAHSWSDATYGWIVERARAQGGRIAVLAATAQDGRLPAYFQSLGAAAAENLLLDSRSAAEDAATAARISGAGGVFIVDGAKDDAQSQYVTMWAGTHTMAAVAEVYRRGGVVAGTGAGAQLLSQVVYDGRAGSLGPAEAFQDARSAKLSFSEDVIPFAPAVPSGEPRETGLLPRLLIDSHFTTGGRLPRLALLLAARADSRPTQPLLGVGVDEKTALLVGPDLIATVRGQGSVTLLRTSAQTQLRLSAGRPPVVTELRGDLLSENFAVDLRTGEVRKPPPSARQLPAAPAVGLGKTVRLDGSSADGAASGAAALKDLATEPLALEHGRLAIIPGRAELPQGLVVTQALSAATLLENRVGGLLWALTSPENPAGRVGLLLPAGASVRATDGLTLEFIAEGPGIPESSALLVDSRAASYTDQSTYVVEPAVNNAPRQSVALLGLRVHVLASGTRMDLVTTQITLPIALTTP